MWTQQGNKKVGGWQFQVPGYPGYVFNATGTYDSGTGTFSGTATCGGLGCGAIGTNQCNASAFCAWNSSFNAGANSWLNTVINLPVTAALQQW